LLLLESTLHGVVDAELFERLFCVESSTSKYGVADRVLFASMY
jgi:hypothetical protein